MFQNGTSDSCLADLMRAAQVGDTRAYAQLLRTIAPRLRDIVLAQSIFLSAEDVEDFVQDLLLSLHALRATYDPRQPFMAWLLAITQNRLVYAARQYGGQPARRVQVDIPPPISNDSANIGTEDYMDSGGDSSPPPGPSEAIESISPNARLVPEHRYRNISDLAAFSVGFDSRETIELKSKRPYKTSPSGGFVRAGL